MPIFKLDSQWEIDENYQGINLVEFSFQNSEDLSEAELIDKFIHSTSFTEESRRACIKNEPDNKLFLRSAFEIDRVKIRDFKRFNKIELVKYLSEYTDNWEESDKYDFIRIKDKFIQSLNTIQSDDFYFISKEWFDENDKRLREPESWIYIYYHLIIWIDKAKEILNVSEWTYD